MSLESGSWVNDLNPSNPPGADPKSMGDDHLRLIKKTLKDSFAGFAGAIVVTGVDGGVVNAYTLTPAWPLVAYTARMLVVFSPVLTNTGAVTMNISGQGVLNVVSVSGAPLVANDLVQGCFYSGFYDGTVLRLANITKNYADQLVLSATLPSIPMGAIPYPLIGRNGVATFAGSVMPRSPRTANIQLVALDSGQEIDITSGTFTQTFASCASLQNGWWVLLRHSGTGRITLDPNGAETIDGLTSFIMYPGEVRAVFCDGATLFSTVIAGFAVSITANETITTPPGYSFLDGEAWSGGTSGQRTNSTSTQSLGGPGGGAFPFIIPVAVLGASFNVVIGQGGASVTGVAAGNPGQDTTIGSVITVKGATAISGGGIISSGTPNPDSGFGAPGGTTTSFSSVWGGIKMSTDASSNGGSSVYGGTCGGSIDAAGNIRLPGATVFGGPGGAAAIAANGSDGTAPGGGGGATQTGTRSGAGARGEVRLRGRA